MHAFSNPLSSPGEFALALISGGVGFAVADFVDRYLATYDPSAVAAGTAKAPTDRFSGGTNGTLANTLNIASPPSLTRIGVGVAVPAALGGLAYLTRKNKLACAALQGATLGAAINTFKVLWNAYVMGNLLKPAATDQATMQKSLGARLYPAETVASQNLSANPPALTAPQGLNAPPRGTQPASRQYAPSPQAQRGVGDPGPFAVGDAPPANNTSVCGPGLVQDSLTGQCMPPCPDGSAPAGGQCPPSGMPGGDENGGPMPVPNPPADCDSGCGLGAQLPEYLGFVTE